MDEELLSVGELAARMAEPGIPESSIAAQLRAYAHRNLIHSFGQARGTGRTAHRLYRQDQWAIAKVLSILHDFGFADATVMQAASIAMQFWQAEELGSYAAADHEAAGVHEHVKRSPMQRAMVGFQNGEDWRFAMELLRDPDTGERQIIAWLETADWQTGSPQNISARRAAVIVPLNQIFERLFARNVFGFDRLFSAR